MFRPMLQWRNRESVLKSRQRSSRRLFFEPLETRRVLAGVVIVDPADDNLTLTGDDFKNHVEVRGTGIGGQFVITGKSNTKLQLEGANQTLFDELTIDGNINDIIVELEGGDDTFELGTEDDDTIEIRANVEITNEDDDTNIITNADIGEDLLVSREEDGDSELQIINTIVGGDVDVDNVADDDEGGDSLTIIKNSEIEGTLDIDNGEGNDTNLIADTSIGAGLFVRPGDEDEDGNEAVPEFPVVSIDNGDGGSLTSFTRQNDPDETGRLPSGRLGRPTVFGGIDIDNGDPVNQDLVFEPPTAGSDTPEEAQTALDIVVFNEVEVLGHLDIDNFDGHTQTVIVDSEIGTDTIAFDEEEPSEGGYGEAVTVENGEGFDVFFMEDSKLPYGLLIDNSGSDDPEDRDEWGSQTEIRNSEIGTRQSDELDEGTALQFFGDDGKDVFNIIDTNSDGTEIGGLVELNLFDGNDSVTIDGVPGTVHIVSLVIEGGDGRDSVFLQDLEVESIVEIELDEGVDTLEIGDRVEFPRPLVGTIELDGGEGADFFTIPEGIPFEGFEIQIGD